MSLPVPLDHISPMTLPDLQALFTNGTRITFLSYEVGRRSRVFVRIDFEDRGRTEHLLNGVLADQPMHNDPENTLMPLDYTNVSYDSEESHLSEPRKDSAIGAKTFKEDILILCLGEVKSLPAVANLDSCCDVGNWISHRLVCDLGRKAEISPSPTTPQPSDANGNIVESCGSISLFWRVIGGSRFHNAEFFVALPKDDASDSWDVIFGAQYLSEKGWLSVNRRVMLPLTEHKKTRPDEKKEIASLEEAQRREKANIESRRLEARKAQNQLKHKRSQLKSGQSQT